MVVKFKFFVGNFRTFAFRRMFRNRRFPDNIPCIRKLIYLCGAFLRFGETQELLYAVFPFCGAAFRVRRAGPE